MSNRGGSCENGNGSQPLPPGRHRIAIYDAPKIMADTISSHLRSKGHDVMYEGPLRPDTAMPDADIWLTKWSFHLKGPLLREVRPRAGLITLSVGKDHIDTDLLQDKGVRLENCPTFCSNSVAEHALALAFRGLYAKSQLPHFSSGPLAFHFFSDKYAEAAVAQILMRLRQLEASIGRARNYDYRRLDEPWSNGELKGLKVGIVGDDRPSSKLARMLNTGFNCQVYSYEAPESLEAFGVKPLFLLELLSRCDYVFLCTERYGLLSPMQSFDSRLLELPTVPFNNSNVAVLGTGRIGSRIAGIAKLGFNCRVKAFSTTKKTDLTDLGIRYCGNIQSAISSANFIFIALPLTGKTRNLIGEKELNALNLQHSHVLVNVTRDEIVDSELLFECISRGTIMNYGTDVLPKDKILWSGGEPDDMTRKFVGHSSVVATPHEADCSRQTLDRLKYEVEEKLRVISDG